MSNPIDTYKYVTMEPTGPQTSRVKTESWPFKCQESITVLCVNNTKVHHSSQNFQELKTHTSKFPTRVKLLFQELSIKVGDLLTCKMQHNKNAIFFQQCQTLI